MEWTLDDIITKIRKDLKLESEKNPTPWSIISAINDAIRDAEGIIVNGFQDYYLTYADYEAIAGDIYFTLPEDIYLARIRYIQYDYDGANDPTNIITYKVKKIPLEDIAYVNSNDPYRYKIVNDTELGLVINIYPTIREDSNNRFRVWYIRKAKTLVELTDVCDIPCIDYIISHVKVRYMKEEGHPFLVEEKEAFLRAERNLIKNTTMMTDDGEEGVITVSNETLNEFMNDYVE